MIYKQLNIKTYKHFSFYYFMLNLSCILVINSTGFQGIQKSLQLLCCERKKKWVIVSAETSTYMKYTMSYGGPSDAKSVWFVYIEKHFGESAFHSIHTPSVRLTSIRVEYDFIANWYVMTTVQMFKMHVMMLIFRIAAD